MVENFKQRKENIFSRLSDDEIDVLFLEELQNLFVVREKLHGGKKSLIFRAIRKADNKVWGPPIPSFAPFVLSPSLRKEEALSLLFLVSLLLPSHYLPCTHFLAGYLESTA